MKKLYRMECDSARGSFSNYETIEDLISASIRESHDSFNTTEHVAHALESNSTMLARLIDMLHKKGILTLEDVGDFVEDNIIEEDQKI